MRGVKAGTEPVFDTSAVVCDEGTCPRPLCDAHRNERERIYARRYRERNPGLPRVNYRRWQERHPDENLAGARERTQRWRERHPERKHAWRENNPDRNRDTARESSRKWREANRDKARMQSSRWRERERGLGGLYVTAYDEWLCRECGDSIEAGQVWHWDHDPPLAWRQANADFEGEHYRRRAHARCNMSKGSRFGRIAS